jgi:hypothetical protein
MAKAKAWFIKFQVKVRRNRTNWSAPSEISNNVYVVWNLSFAVGRCKSRGTCGEKEKFALLNSEGAFIESDARMEASHLLVAPACTFPPCCAMQ